MRIAPNKVVLYAVPMDETTLQTLRELAEQHGLDPERLLAVADEDGLPDDLRRAVAAVLGDITLFGKTLREKDR